MKKIMMMVVMLAGFAATTYAAGYNEVGQRQYNLHERIAQGRCSRELNGREVRVLNCEHTGIGREIRFDRRAHGGRLTPVERCAINRQQNDLSRQVYCAKH